MKLSRNKHKALLFPKQETHKGENGHTAMASTVDEEFTNDIRAALDQSGTTNLTPILAVVGGLFAAFLLWASLAEVEEVTSGLGRIIPSSQMQLVQPFEAGIVRAIEVSEGDIVEANQVLLMIDDTDASSTLGELQQKRAALVARQTRFLAEARGVEPEFAADTPPDILEGEKQLYEARRHAFAEEQTVLVAQLEQRRQEFEELQIKISETENSIALMDRELELARGLFQRKAIPELDFLQRERAAVAERRELAVSRAQLPRSEAAMAEARAQLSNLEAQFRSQARDELAQVIGDLAVIVESIRAAQERLERTILTAPVRGIVNSLPVTTIGAVIRPGENVVEIVPLDETLYVDAEIRPQDIAFISPGQLASVKVTAYDYTVYGDLAGTVQRISADTFEDEKGNTFYRVTIEIKENSLGKNPTNPLPLIPGMIVTADILTGQKTVLEYLLNPITRARNEALRER